ncbi:unnamed protein product [Nippostrongylus brasiliensis]|uniref:Uncharacterized protein n=1 Tax=Nippostrongylus brasiliensis TaxID=27835 RepID=A0A0N4XZ47_NIPBR|nr:unnamed protein product [Nippostrongylus brasiliensis]
MEIDELLKQRLGETEASSTGQFLPSEKISSNAVRDFLTILHFGRFSPISTPLYPPHPPKIPHPEAEEARSDTHAFHESLLDSSTSTDGGPPPAVIDDTNMANVGQSEDIFSYAVSTGIKSL